MAGIYKLTVFAKLVGARAPDELIRIDLSISELQAARLSAPNAGIYFDWGPDQQNYHPHISVQPDTEKDL